MSRTLFLFAFLVGCSSDDSNSGEGDITDDTGADVADDTGGDDTSDDTSDDTGEEPIEQLLQDGWLSSLAVTDGCEDALIFARNADDTLAVVFQAYNVALTAHSIDSAYSQSYSLPSSSALVYVYLGERLTGNYCLADSGSGTRVLDAVYVPISGQARITVTPSGEATESGDYPADAYLQLSDVELVEQSDDIQVGSISMLEVWTEVGVQP